MDALALAALGRDDVSIYDGSMTEWAADPALMGRAERRALQPPS